MTGPRGEQDTGRGLEGRPRLAWMMSVVGTERPGEGAGLGPAHKKAWPALYLLGAVVPGPIPSWQASSYLHRVPPPTDSEAAVDCVL